MYFFLGIAIFIAVFLFVLSIYFIQVDIKEKERRKALSRILEVEDMGESGVPMSRQQFLGRKLFAYLNLSRLERLISESGHEIVGDSFASICVASGLVLTVVSTLVFKSYLMVIPVFGVGAAIPLGYLLYCRYKRETALVSQLPDAIDMLSRGLRAGQGLDAALREVSKSYPDPLGCELRQIYEEMKMGLSFGAAVRGFERRFDRVADVKMLCAALLIQRETGGNLTMILDNISHTIRERFAFFRQVRALSAEGRLSATILGLLPVAFGFITWLLRPDYIYTLFTHPVGKQALLAAIIMEIVGFVMMFRLAKVEA